MRFDGKIVVTGGAKGIGREICILLAAYGAKIITCGRDEAALKLLASQIPDLEYKIINLSDPINTNLWAQELSKRRDILGLINNAGIQFNMRLKDQSLEQIICETNTNFIAPIILCQNLVENITKNNGFIANISSGLAIAPKATSAVYCASKAGISSFSQGLRNQYKNQSIVICDILMTLVDTEMVAGRGNGKIAPKIAAQEVIEAIMNRRETTFVGKVKLLNFINRLSPNIARNIMGR